MQVAAEMRTDTGVTTFKGSGLKVAGTTATFDGRLDEKGWQVKGSTGTTTVAALRKFAAPWFAASGRHHRRRQGVRRRRRQRCRQPARMLDATLKLDGVDLTNEASTIVTDKLAATARLRARLNEADTGAADRRRRANRARCS